MHFSEQLQVPAPLADAWEFIWDTQRLGRCLPGCVSVAEVTPGELYKARFEDHVGPYKVGFDLDIKVLETVPMDRVHIQASGRDPKLGVTQRIDLTVALTDAGEVGTSLAVEAEVEVLGKIATLGQFVIKRKAQDVVKQFAHNIEAELQPATAGS
ncbi:MAG TPA: SRPBCC domain-containing protein [Chloroflexota bacterium]